MEPRLIKVPAVVARLGLSRAKVYELMANGDLRSVRIAGARRVDSEDLERFVAGLDDSWPTGADYADPAEFFKRTYLTRPLLAPDPEEPLSLNPWTGCV